MRTGPACLKVGSEIDLETEQRDHFVVSQLTSDENTRDEHSAGEVRAVVGSDRNRLHEAFEPGCEDFRNQRQLD